MGTTPPLVISQDDFHKISALLSIARLEIVELLEGELARAHIVEKEQLPANVVAMNSKVTFIDLDTEKEQTVILSFPHEANIEQNRISVLAPIGAALIGLSVGQTIDWPISEQKMRRIRVTQVAH